MANIAFKRTITSVYGKVLIQPAFITETFVAVETLVRFQCEVCLHCLLYTSDAADE